MLRWHFTRAFCAGLDETKSVDGIHRDEFTFHFKRNPLFAIGVAHDRPTNGFHFHRETMNGSHINLQDASEIDRTTMGFVLIVCDLFGKGEQKRNRKTAYIPTNAAMNYETKI